MIVHMKWCHVLDDDLRPTSWSFLYIPKNEVYLNSREKLICTSFYLWMGLHLLFKIKNNANYVEHNRTKRLSFNVETFIFISFHFILSFLYFLSSYIVRKKWLISPKSNTRRIERGCYLKYYYFKCRTLSKILRNSIA